MRPISCDDIAALMGCATQRIRVLTQAGCFPFASYCKGEEASVGAYFFDPYNLAEHIGIDRFDRYFGKDFFEV